MANRVRFAIRLEKIIQSDRVVFQGGFSPQQGVQPGADGKALFGQSDRRGKQLAPGQAAVLAVGLCQHAHGARHAHGAPAHQGFHEGQGLALVVEKQCGAGCGGGGFTAVERLQTLSVVVQQKSAAAYAAGLWFHQGQHHLHGNGSIHRAAAFAQHLSARFGGQRVGRCHGKTVVHPAGFGADARGEFGLCQRVGCAGGPVRAPHAGTGPHHPAGHQRHGLGAQQACAICHGSGLFRMCGGAAPA